MKRTERFLNSARHEGLVATTLSAVGISAGVWAVVAALYDGMPGGFLLAVAAAAVLRLASVHWSERRRLLELAAVELRFFIVPARRAATGPDGIAWLVLGVAVGAPCLAAVIYLLWK